MQRFDNLSQFVAHAKIVNCSVTAGSEKQLQFRPCFDPLHVLLQAESEVGVEILRGNRQKTWPIHLAEERQQPCPIPRLSPTAKQRQEKFLLSAGFWLGSQFMGLPGSNRCRRWTAQTSKLHQDSRDSPRQPNVNLHASTKQHLGRPASCPPFAVESDAALQWAPFPTHQVLCDDP